MIRLLRTPLARAMIGDTGRMHPVAQRQHCPGGSWGDLRMGGVMSADQEYSGDYGYDLAHEVKAGLHDIPRPRSAPRMATAAAASLHVDLHSDLGYDSAHEGGS
jgi:hypothetical protein